MQAVKQIKQRLLPLRVAGSAIDIINDDKVDRFEIVQYRRAVAHHIAQWNVHRTSMVATEFTYRGLDKVRFPSSRAPRQCQKPWPLAFKPMGKAV